MGYPEDNFKGMTGAKANPNGRPLYWETWDELYKKYSLMSVDELEVEIQRKDLKAKYAIVIKDLIRASEGTDKPIERIQDRTDGKPLQRQENTVKMASDIVEEIDNYDDYADSIKETQ